MRAAATIAIELAVGWLLLFAAGFIVFKLVCRLLIWLLDLLDELRAQLPIEIKRAQELLAAREKFVEDAKRDVDRMMRQAELEAKAKVSDSEVLTAAREKGRAIVDHAEERSRQLYQVANEYAEDALARTEEAIQMALDEIKQSRVRFRSASAAKMQEQKQKLESSPTPPENEQETP